MDLNQVKEMAEIMREHDLSELSLEEGEVKVTLKRGGGVGVPMVPMAAAGMAGGMAPAGAAGGGAVAVASAGDEGGEAGEGAGVGIRSPLVGTFYRAASPEAEPFVRVGDRVGAETVVCLIEAMKVMNEVKAETAGVIREIRVENGAAVQYGQELFRVEPE